VQHNIIPISTIHLFPKIDRLLIELLRSLSVEEWNYSTIAKLWTVKDIATHLLDGNLRTLSYSRDKHAGEKPIEINSYNELVAYLNQLNADWIKATKRLSPNILIELLEATGMEYSRHLETLDPFEDAAFSVAWAGEQQSKNWFHIAREYTEKFIHQQQIRDAVNKPGLLIKELFYPFIDTFMRGLPYTYRHTTAGVGTTIKLTIESECGGDWYLIKTQDAWALTKDLQTTIAATISFEPDVAWKLFSKGITPEIANQNVSITGDRNLAEIALKMISVMA
jgi:hypothetical protein